MHLVGFIIRIRTYFYLVRFSINFFINRIDMILQHDSFSILKILFLSLHLIFYFTKIFTPFPQRKTGRRMGKWHLRVEKLVPVDDSA